MSQVLIYVGPPFLELANYHVLGRLLSYIPWLAPVPPKRVLDTFGALIAAVEGLNGLGIAFTSNPDGNHQGLGQGLVLASLGVQICLIACFVVITSVFHWRCCKANVQNKAIPALPLTLYQSTAFMVIRSIYRLVEHAGNSSLDLDNPDELRSLSPLMRYEWYFYVFEGTTMLLNSLVWNIWHAGRFLPTNAKAFLAQDGKTEIDSPQEVAGPSALAPVLYLVMQLLTFGNERIYPSILPHLEIAPTAYVFRISPFIFQKGLSYPDHLKFMLVCTSLTHRMNQNEAHLRDLEKTFFHYRGQIIRSLRDSIDAPSNSTGDLVIAGTLTLLLIDVQQGASHRSWRYHLEAVRKIIQLRGGMGILAKLPGVVPLLLCFVLFTVIGDTTSPASDLTMAPAHLVDLQSIIKQYGDTSFAFTVHPAPILVHIMQINSLRARAITATQLTEITNLTHDAYEIRGQILKFSPEQWAQTKQASKNDCSLLGNIYQAAAVIYCISSLQSLSVLPITPFLQNTCMMQSNRLRDLLTEALSGPKFQRFLLWPLVVLGVEAAHGGTAMRGFVQHRLADMRRRTGIHAPAMAKAVLERFWDSGRTCWDDCFDEPHVFVMHPGLDLSRL
ncbi:hypothetical protein N8T08_001453 [Aspergillus melleus]|uniref:Uncharacterized protein n=1 Tax=Aspergillus melleus TaxID=138277 RepID=A0ACC3B9P8_9EURO|nr:hypothetical protein N8T08_001453 [Aspergillus melleus]